MSTVRRKKNIKKQNVFTVRNFSVSVDGTEIVHDCSFSLSPGSINLLVGPNGSGKSTLLNAVFGNPRMVVTKGSLLLDGTSLNKLPVDKRSLKGLFFGFQQPAEIAGVTLASFLRGAKNARLKKTLSPVEFTSALKPCLLEVGVDERFGGRFLNAGFSGGEKKKSELLQMIMLEPRFAFLDEFDSGLDIDALRNASNLITRYAKDNNTGFLLVTHNPRIGAYLPIDNIHVMVAGSLVASGGTELLQKIEKEGYTSFSKNK